MIQKKPLKASQKKIGKAEKAPANKKIGKPRNYDLGNGILRFSRTRMYHKKALYKFMGKVFKPKKKETKPRVVEKKIGGEKNGGKRFVLVKKRRAFYPTQDKIKPRPSKKTFRNHKRTLRPGLTPGTILILLAGRHKGKRVVFLKQLDSGLLLVTGPYKINGVPLRRISQRYVIVTKTKIELKEFSVPPRVNDKYFLRKRQKRAKKEEGDIFQTKKEGYKPSPERKEDQDIVDKLIFKSLSHVKGKKLVLAYLSSMWGLRSSQYPHRMKF